jgi:hypothetical protein
LTSAITSLTASATRVDASGKLSSFAAPPSTTKYGASVFCAGSSTPARATEAAETNSPHDNSATVRSNPPNMSKSFRRLRAGVSALTATAVLAVRTPAGPLKSREAREFAARVRRVVPSYVSRATRGWVALTTRMSFRLRVERGGRRARQGRLWNRKASGKQAWWAYVPLAADRWWGETQ